MSKEKQKHPKVYDQIIERIFFNGYRAGVVEIPFARAELVKAANDLKVKVPSNLGDVVYSYRFRAFLPDAVSLKAPRDRKWVIVKRGKSDYAFETRAFAFVFPDKSLPVTKIPEATPSIVSRYAQNDEQALLARLRYNRLIDVFTGVTCYSLQNHLRATITGVGQIEIDELYVGIDKRGAHYVYPVQAKGGSDLIGVVQLEQDLAYCAERYPNLICRSIAAQFMGSGVIAIFEFDRIAGEVRKTAERHYMLVPSDQLSDSELADYHRRSEIL